MELVIMIGMPLLLILIWCAETILRGHWVRHTTALIYGYCQDSTRVVEYLRYEQLVVRDSIHQRALDNLVSLFTDRPAHKELVGSTALLLQILMDLQNSLPHTPALQSLFDECYLLLDRRGKVCRHMLAVLQADKVADMGVFRYIEHHFFSLVQDELPDLEIECNMPNRRFSVHIEKDLAKVCMVLLMHTLYNRTPTYLRFYLVYAGNTATLYIMDDDSHSETNLDLYHMPRADWLPCYQIANTLATIYNGHLTLDPTYTKGLSLELKMIMNYFFPF